MSASDSTDSKLAQALAECERLQMENRQLRERLGIPPVDTVVQIVSESSTQVTVTAKSSPDEKVKLFTEGKQVVKLITVPDKLVNIVVK